MQPRDFFKERRETSEIKSLLVTQYFDAWSRVIARRAPRIAYIDLFAGPGRYEDGKKSTPLMVLELAVNRPDLREKLVTLFNDADPDAVRNLRHEIRQLPGISGLRYEPRVVCSEIDDEVAAELESHRLVPSFVFIDPWGYRGLTLRLVRSVVKDWGSDCVFFFNYTRINMGLSNDRVEPHMRSIFGDERLRRLQQLVSGRPAPEREEIILNELAEALKGIGARYILPFRFRLPDGGRTTHHLVFITKHVRGFEIMKDIMYRHGRQEEGVARFEYFAVTVPQVAQLLLELAPKPLDVLEAELLRRFSGRTLSVRELYKAYGEGTFYVRANHREVLRRLEQRGVIRCDPPAERRQRREGIVTMGDNVRVTFP